MPGEGRLARAAPLPLDPVPGDERLALIVPLPLDPLLGDGRLLDLPLVRSDTADEVLAFL